MARIVLDGKEKPNVPRAAFLCMITGSEYPCWFPIEALPRVLNLLMMTCLDEMNKKAAHPMTVAEKHALLTKGLDFAKTHGLYRDALQRRHRGRTK